MRRGDGRTFRTLGSAGFTLIELLVVVVILGVLASMVSIHRGDFLPAHEIRQAGLQVTSHLRLARAKALSHNTPVRIIFPAGGTSYHAEWLNPDTDTWEDYALQGRGEGARGNTARITIPDPTFVPGAATISFQPRGTLDINGDNQVEVAHSRIEEGMLITVEPNGLVGIP